MKKLFYFIVIIFLINGIISQSDELGSIPTKTQKLDQTIQEETSIGESIGLTSDKNDNIKVKNVKITRGESDTNTKITSLPGSSIKIKGDDGVEREYSLEKLDIKSSSGQTSTKDGEIVLDKNGNIVEAIFTVGKTGKFKFGDDDEIELPKGTGVIFKNGVVQIALPADNSKVPTPTKITGKGEQKITFEFSSRDPNGLVLENKERFQGILKYSDSKFYFDKDVNLGSLLIKNQNNVKTYLDFKGEVSTSYDSAYISMNREAGKIVIGQNGGIEGPSVMFNPDPTNPYGVWVENDDHFAVKALGEPKSSYLAISKRDSTGLVPRGEMVGGVAINEDNAGIYTKDNGVYLKNNGRVITGLVNDGKGLTTIPIELAMYNYVDGKLVPISKEGNIAVISNRVEIGYGPNPDNIMGSAYYKDYPVITRKVSNRINYNYVEFSEKGFENYARIPLTMDSYSRGKMTPDKFRMLIDIVDSATPNTMKNLKSEGIDVVRAVRGSAMGVIAWGGPGGIQIQYRNLDPGTIRHEMVHAATLGKGSRFWNEWESVGGGSIARTSSYGRTNEMEDAAEYGGEFIYKSPDYTKTLLNGKYGKYYRAKLAVLAKHDVISMNDYNLHMSYAGLETGPESINKYIGEAK
ncbi:MAG: hypothetical protein WC867_02590 [Candidatus Pacearchaeota archaeon]|jgi:hypothetical protein